MRCLTKWVALLAALIPAAAVAQTGDASYRGGDRMAGYYGTSPQGLAIIVKTLSVDLTGNYVAPGGGGGGGSVTAASNSYALGSIIDIGTGATPGANTVNGRLATINTTLGSPLQAGGTVTANLGTLNGVATAANQTATGTAAQTVQGNIGVGTTDSGNPVLGGCYGTTANPAQVTAGQRQRLWCFQNGQLAVAIVNSAGTGAGIGVPNDTFASANSIYTTAQGMVYNDGQAQFVRQRGDVTGIWQGGHATLATGQVSVGTTATLIAAARTGRQKIGVTVTTAVQCAFGASGVTLTTGWPLAAVAYVSDSWDTNAALYGVCASTATVGWREQY